MAAKPSPPVSPPSDLALRLMALDAASRTSGVADPSVVLERAEVFFAWLGGTDKTRRRIVQRNQSS